MNIKKLYSIAKNLGIKYYATFGKPELIDEIAKNLGIKYYTCKNKRELLDEINEKKEFNIERFSELSNMNINKLYSIAKNLRIKYFARFDKLELIDEIIEKESNVEICEHEKKKYKCSFCAGENVCEHSSHKDYCKICREKRENYKSYVKSIFINYKPIIESIVSK